MSSASLAKKLLVRPGQRVLILNAPEGFTATLAPSPEGAEIVTTSDGTCDVVLLFAHTRAEMEPHAAAALAALKPGGVFWGCYPKGSSRMQTDLTRDIGWDAVTGAGWEGVAAVSIDATWSGTRFRPTVDVGRARG